MTCHWLVIWYDNYKKNYISYLIFYCCSKKLSRPSIFVLPHPPMQMKLLVLHAKQTYSSTTTTFIGIHTISIRQPSYETRAQALIQALSLLSSNFMSSSLRQPTFSELSMSDIYWHLNWLLMRRWTRSCEEDHLFNIFLIQCHLQTHVVSHTPYVLYKYLNQ